MLGQAHLSHPAKQDLAWAVGGGWAVSPAAHWVANMGSASANRRRWLARDRHGPFGLARLCASRVANAPLV